jgi:hypothetical protein
MKIVITLGLLSAATIAGVAVAPGAENEAGPAKPRETMRDTVNIDLDEQSAVQIAEVVLVRVYGKKVLGQRPWNVTKGESAFKIVGSLPKGWDGGVASIEINRRNAQVISIIHEK